MSERIRKAEAFLREKLESSPGFKDEPERMRYRLEHSIRVANIGRKLAEKEGFDVEAFMIACLLHDVSYCMEFKTREDQMNHGRYSAKIARPFLQELGYEGETLNEICYGIAIHVDEEADFPGEKTAFALSVGDADNIDRFDVWRIYENMKYNLRLEEMPLPQRIEKLTVLLEKLKKFRELPFATATATEIWHEKLDYQTEFYNKLLEQYENSRIRYGEMRIDNLSAE